MAEFTGLFSEAHIICAHLTVMFVMDYMRTGE